MKAKIVALILLTAIALSIISYSYACLNGEISINCCCNCGVKFIRVTTSDNEVKKDVANVTAQINCAGDAINAYITNGYPCYRAYINYTIKNTGCKPVHFDSVTIVNNYPLALEIATTNHTCTWLSPCETVKGTTTVHILQTATQTLQYTFQIKISFSCQEGYPHTIGFWKNQFSQALCKNGWPQVPAATLEQYLNQINSQSQIFSFAGTRTQKFQLALSILSPSNNAIMKDKLKAQLLALWLNYMAGWTGGYKYGGKTAEQIIQSSESVLKNGQSSQYEYWKNMCEGFNNIGG